MFIRAQQNIRHIKAVKLVSVFLFLVMSSLPTQLLAKTQKNKNHHSIWKGFAKKGKHKDRWGWFDDNEMESDVGVLNCDDAYASRQTLWPVNHRFKRIKVMGLKSPIGKPDVKITCVQQDEPLNSTGDGNTRYDAKRVYGDSVALRKERKGNSNGRVYYVSFTATAGDQTCSGQVEVQARHHPRKPAVGEGAIYNSLKDVSQCPGVETPVNRAPVITSEPEVKITAGSPYTYKLAATDPDGDPISYQLLDAPEEMSISDTGVVRWNTDRDDVGEVNVSVLASDGMAEDIQNFSITIVENNRAPEILSTPVREGKVGQEYMYQVFAVDPDDDPLTYEILRGPDGMVFDDFETLIWTPTADQVGKHMVTVKVMDDKGLRAIQCFQVIVTEADDNGAPFFTSDPETNAFDNAPYRYLVTAEDPDGDELSYKILDGPEGMELVDNNGVLTLRWLATARQGQNVPVTLEVKDPSGLSATQTFNIFVLAR